MATLVRKVSPISLLKSGSIQAPVSRDWLAVKRHPPRKTGAKSCLRQGTSRVKFSPVRNLL